MLTLLTFYCRLFVGIQKGFEHVHLRRFTLAPPPTESSRTLHLRPPRLRTQPHRHRPDPGAVEEGRRGHEGEEDVADFSASLVQFRDQTF